MLLFEKYKLIRGWLWDLLFPKKCVNCGQEGGWICDSCKKLLFINKIHRCPVCREIQIDSRTCNQCLGESFLNGLWTLSNYSNPLVQKIILLIKYSYIFDLSHYLDQLMKDYFAEIDDWDHEAILVPIPLHRQRFLRRGFNQAELICNRLNLIFGNKVEINLVVRKINNKPQAKLLAQERGNNVKGIFGLNKNIDLKKLIESHVILVDDVYTTGSTMQECAKILKEAGFKNVRGLVVARD